MSSFRGLKGSQVETLLDKLLNGEDRTVLAQKAQNYLVPPLQTTCSHGRKQGA